MLSADKLDFYSNQFKILLKDPFNFQTWDIALRDKEFVTFLSGYHESNKGGETAYHLLAKLAKKEIWNHSNVAKIAEKFGQAGVVFHYAHLNNRGLDAETLAYKEGNFLLGRTLNEIGKIESRKQETVIVDTIQDDSIVPPPESDMSLNWNKVANPNVTTREELADIQWNENLSLNYGRDVAYDNWLHT